MRPVGPMGSPIARGVRDDVGVLAAVAAIAVGVVLFWSISAPWFEMPLGRDAVGILAAAAIAGGFGLLGYRFERAWLGIFVTLLVPALFVEPSAWVGVSFGSAFVPCCEERGASLFAGLSWILGAGIRRVRTSRPENRGSGSLQAGLVLVVGGAAVIGVDAAIAASLDPLAALAPVAILTGIGLWGWKLRAWWPAVYLASTVAFLVVVGLWSRGRFEGGLPLVLGAFGVALLPSATYLLVAGARRLVSRM